MRKARVNYGRRIRNVEGIAIPVTKHTGPKPRRYIRLCVAECSCAFCYRYPTSPENVMRFLDEAKQ